MRFPIGKRQLLMEALDKTGCNRLFHRVGVWNGLLVVTYHRVGEAPETVFDRELWSVTEEDFGQQLEFLKQHFDVIGIDDLPDICRRQSPRHGRRGRYVMITFDDGYRDNFDLAFPILKSHAATGCFFVSTGYLDRPHVPWWDEIAWMVRSSRLSHIAANKWTGDSIEFVEPDRQHAVRRLLGTFYTLAGHETEAFLDFLADATAAGRCPADLASDTWMTWDMVRQMRREGMCIGGHTVKHPILANLTLEEQDLEICECRLRIEQELGEEIDAFSYPVGKPNTFNQLTRQCLSKHGFRWAFSYYGGYNRFQTFDPMDICRIAIEADVNIGSFRSIAALPQLFA